MAFDTSMYEWRKYKAYYSEENGVVSFRQDTPQHVLDSYAKYAAQQEAMHDFATRNDLKKKRKNTGLFSRPKASPHAKTGAELLFEALRDKKVRKLPGSRLPRSGSMNTAGRQSDFRKWILPALFMKSVSWQSRSAY